MDVVVRGRGARVDAQTKGRLERKLGRLSRLDGRIDRIEVEVTFEPSERIAGGHRIEASCRSGRKTYRAHADGSDVDIALDRLVQRLERQISDSHRKRLNRTTGTSGKVQSARMGQNQGEPPPP
jgi:ribosomal subunit interface protein